MIESHQIGALVGGQQVMFANTSDWRFDRPGENYYVQFIDRATSGDLDELARITPDAVGVRGAVCRKGDRTGGVHWEAVAEFSRQLELRQSGEIAVRGEPAGVSSRWGWQRLGRHRRHRRKLRRHPGGPHRAGGPRPGLHRRGDHPGHPEQVRCCRLGREGLPLRAHSEGGPQRLPEDAHQALDDSA